VAQPTQQITFTNLLPEASAESIKEASDFLSDTAPKIYRRLMNSCVSLNIVLQLTPQCRIFLRYFLVLLHYMKEGESFT
jgi:hypothetical protein